MIKLESKDFNQSDNLKEDPLRLYVQTSQEEKIEKKYACHFAGCNAKFLKPGLLQCHIDVHNNERIFKCDFEGCDKSYTRAQHLQRHKKTHNDIKRSVMCNDCGKWIGNFSNLKRHYQRFHESRESFCDACGKLFRKLNLYQEHMAMHKKSQVYQCETCEKKFNSQSKLHKHTQYHLPKDYVICRKKECYQKFDNLETLKEHEKNNHPPKDKNLKEFKCAFETCGKIFNKKFNLQQHINSKHIHIKVKCDHCGKRLSTKPALIKHIKVFHSCTPRPPIKKPLVRKPRKDKGIPKRSELSKLCGFNLLPTIEKDVIDRSETVLTSLNEIQESDNIHFWKVSVDKAFNENLVDEELQGNEEADTI